MSCWCSAVKGGVRLAVQIQPNAKKTEVIGLHDDALKLRLHAAPVEGKANEALVRYLAERLGVPKSAIAITHGHTSKRKLVEVAGASLTPEQVVARLAPDQ